MRPNTEHVRRYLTHVFKQCQEQMARRHHIEETGDNEEELKKFRENRRPWIMGFMWLLLSEEAKLSMLGERRLVYLVNHMMYIDGCFKFTAAQLYASLNHSDTALCRKLCIEEADSLYKFYFVRSRDKVPERMPGGNFYMRSNARRHACRRLVTQALSNCSIEKMFTVLENNQTTELFELFDDTIHQKEEIDIIPYFLSFKLKLEEMINRRFQHADSPFSKGVSKINKINDAEFDEIKRTYRESGCNSEESSDIELEEEEEERFKSIDGKEASTILEKLRSITRK